MTLAARATLVVHAWREDRMLQNGRRFGRDLADRMAVRMRFQRVTVEQVTLNAATEVAKRANEMLTAGTARDDVAAWIEQVQVGYAERLDEDARAAGSLHRS